MNMVEAKNVMELMIQRKIERAAEARGNAERFHTLAPLEQNLLRAGFVRQVAERNERYADAIEKELDAIRVIMNFVEAMEVKN